MAVEQELTEHPALELLKRSVGCEMPRAGRWEEESSPLLDMLMKTLSLCFPRALKYVLHLYEYRPHQDCIGMMVGCCTSVDIRMGMTKQLGVRMPGKWMMVEMRLDSRSQKSHVATPEDSWHELLAVAELSGHDSEQECPN